MNSKINDDIEPEFLADEQESSGDFQIDLQEYLRTFRRFRLPIVMGSVFATLLAAVYVSTITPVFQSTSTLLIEAQQANLVSIEQLYGLEAEDRDYYLTQHELLKSRKLAERVVAALDLHNREITSPVPPTDPADLIGALKGVFMPSPGAENAANESANPEMLPQIAEAEAQFDKLVDNVVQQQVLPDSSADAVSGGFNIDALTPSERQAFNATVNEFRRNLAVTPVRNTKLVKLSYNSIDPEVAALVANAVGEQYILSFLDAKLELTLRASRWLEDKLAQSKLVLEESEQRLIKFKEDNNLIDVNGSVGKLNETTLILATTELAKAKSDLSNAEELFNEVTNLQNTAPEFLYSVPAIQNDPLVRSVKVEQGQAQRQLDELLNRYGPRHPQGRELLLLNVNWMPAALISN